MEYPRPRSAFTIMEVLVVIVIIAVLVGFLVPAIHTAIANSKISQTKAEIRHISEALAAFEEAFGVRVPDFLRISAHPVTVDNGRGIIVDGGDGLVDAATTLGGDDTWFDGSTAAFPGPAPIFGRILILPGPDGILQSSVDGDDQIVHNAFYTPDPTPTPGAASFWGAADLNGPTDPISPDPTTINGDLDAAECLFYFLCTTWKKDPQPPVDYIAQTFALSYVNDPTAFQFVPPPWMRRADGGPFYEIAGLQARDTDGDGYLELCDLFGNPVHYVAVPPPMIIEPIEGGNGTVDTTAAGGSDDMQIASFGSSVSAGQLIIHPGPDWILQTLATADDIISNTWCKKRVGFVYSDGPNGIDNLGFDDSSLGMPGIDDDNNGVEDDEDDITNL